MPRPIHLCGLVVLIAACGLAAAWRVAGARAAAAATQPATAPAADAAVPLVKVDLSQAIALALPELKNDLKAEPFTTKDGKSGWALRIAGNRPIATPAYADGMIFVGGGYGSHEFYAFDADSGKLVWQIKTADDGPTAAVVEDGYVAFNTESCTVIIADAHTGKLIWQEWLGDPLMSQPAISNGKLFMAYPGGHPRGVQAGANVPVEKGNPALDVPGAAAGGPAAGAGNVGPAKLNGHRLLCADLVTGRHIWEQDITADVISAPILDGDKVFFTCFDGTSFCLGAKDGTVVWKKQNAGTSAPLVADGQVIVTEKDVKGDRVQEGVRRLDAAGGAPRDTVALASGNAEYLKQGKTGNVALAPTSQAALDSAVGFADAPAAANLPSAAKNVNVHSVVAGWSYQGAKAGYAHGQILNAQGNHFNCVRSDSGRVAWRAEVVGKEANADLQMFAPPALGSINLYVCSAQGHLMSLRQKDGQLAFAYATCQPMAFQPALARGNVYAPTTGGLLICLKTGEKDADGWTAWGGNAQHNKKQ